MDSRGEPAETRQAELGLWDAISLIVGIVVGVSIFKAPPTVFSNVVSPWQGAAAWGLGGVVALIGALCYAELATRCPGSGGDYLYLTRAFGKGVGFLFAWAQLVVILTGSIAAMAYIFADYAGALFGCDRRAAVWFAGAAVAGSTLFNALGLTVGKSLQNLLTVAKVAGLGSLVAIGLLKGSASSWHASEPVRGPGYGLAFILVLYAFGGWNDIAFVAADVRQPRRNMPRALILGTLLISAIYVLVNVAFVHALGFNGLRTSRAPAADVFGLWLGEHGVAGMSLLVMVSALGAVSGLILTGSRVHASAGADHRIFSWLGRWNERFHSPVGSLTAQACVALLLIVGVGTEAGRDAIDRALIGFGASAMPWKEYDGGFDTLVAGTAPVFWLFFLLSGIALIVLRRGEQSGERPFTTPLYPLVPTVFIAVCGYMLYVSIAYARALCLLGIVPLAAGIPLFLISSWRSDRKPATRN